MSTAETAVPIDTNGVPLDKLRGTIAKLTENPDLAAFEFSAKTTWVEGTAARLIVASANRSAVFDILVNPTSVDVRPAR